MRLSTPQPNQDASGAAPPVVILLVDDNAKKRVALKAILGPLGYRIVEADSGVAALRCLLGQNFAVILLDVRMPFMDGFETAALIRQRRQSEMTPIIFITAHGADQITQDDRYSEGAVDFIFAPIDPAELRAKVSVFANLFIRAEVLAVQAREVRATADQLRLLTDAAPIGIFQTDAANRYVYTNTRWSEITGIPAEHASEQPWDFIIDAAQRAELFSDSDAGTPPAGPTRRVEIRLPGPTPRIALLIARSIPGRDGGIAGWVGTLADITAEAGAEAAMSEARDAAISASATQKSFAASASHELRTPTTSILGYTEEVLDGERLSAEDRGFLEIVYRNAQRLSQLIDDLLIVGEAEIGASMMTLAPTALAPLVDGAIANFSSAALHAGVALVVDLGRDTPWALVDPLRLEQALANLISNALKFTPRGGEVRVSVGRGDTTVEINVADTGVGIDPADLESIFSRFFRAKSAIDSAVKGSGLGLAIAKRMIEAQNGRMSVTSELGQGSTFTMSLPAAARELQHA